VAIKLINLKRKLTMNKNILIAKIIKAKLHKNATLISDCGACGGCGWIAA
jgi:hypothetical protein